MAIDFVRTKQGANVETEKCVLYDRDCIGCMECEICDLDPNKICDNCGKCLDIPDSAVIKIDRIILEDKSTKSV